MKRKAFESINDELFERAEPELDSFVGANARTLCSTLGLTGSPSSPDYIFDADVDFSLQEIE